MSSAVTLSAQGLRRRLPGGHFELAVERLEVAAGTTLAVVGPSGSGKTTLLEILGLLQRPDEGSVMVDGATVDHRDRRARLQMAAVFQRPYLFKGSVEGNVEYGLAARGVRRFERGARVAAALERVGLSGYGSRSALSLSGGEAQRVSLARALVVEPRVLLLDEPLASLDRPLRRRLTQEFASILGEAGVTAVWVTHDQDEALVVADRMAVLNAGRLVAHGLPEEVMGLAVDEWSAGFFGVERANEGLVANTGDGLTALASAGSVVFVTGTAPVGAAALFSVHPEDVLLFESEVELPLTTARNRLHVRVVAVEPRGSTVYASLEAPGVRIASSVSRVSARELGVAPGAELLAVFKAAAVRWRLAQAASQADTMQFPRADADSPSRGSGTGNG